MFLPQILGTSYGWLQIAIYKDYTLLPLYLIGLIIIFKIIATSLTIGSGGSAGVFGPSMVIGGFLGAFIGTVVHMLGLFAWVDVSSVIIVSMVSFFGATAKTPISSIIMGSELTGGYALLAPMMLATFVAYIMSGQHSSIFRNQVLSRSDSPAHKREYQRPILRDLYVKDIFRKSLTKLSPDISIDEALQSMNRDRTKTAAVVNENDRLLGVVNRHKFFEIPEEYRKTVKLDSVMIKDPFFVYMTDSLHNALVRLSSNDLQEMPVLSDEDNRVLGVVTISDLVKLYDNEVQKIMKVRKDNGSLRSESSDSDSNPNHNPNPEQNLKKR